MGNALVWTGGATGFLAFIAFTVAGIVVYIADDWWSGAAGFAALALCGAIVSFAAHRWLEGERRRREAERVRVNGLWTGTEFTAGMHWRKFVWGIGGAIAVLVMCAAALRSQERGLVIAGVIETIIFAPMLALEVLLMAAVLRTGYVLRLDARGIHHCSGTTVPWSDVWTVELEVATFRMLQVVRIEYLLAVLQPHATPGGYGGGSLRRLIGPRLQNRGTRMMFGIGAATAAPDLLLHAARVIGGRAGVPMGQGWSGFRSDRSHALGAST